MKLPLTLALLLFSVAAACAQTVINTVPYTISSSGKYVLGTNLNNLTEVNAITISAPNVILDLDGFYVSGTGNTASNHSVIDVLNVANVSIRNGLLANAGYGIVFEGGSNSRNYMVENVTISRCYLAGLDFVTSAPGSILRNNSFSNIGGTTFESIYQATALFTFGGVRVENNSISNVTSTPSGQPSYGITANAGDFLIGNTISGCYYGISGGKYLNNLTSGCTVPFNEGTNATGNN